IEDFMSTQSELINIDRKPFPSVSIMKNVQNPVQLIGRFRRAQRFCACQNPSPELVNPLPV
ncbi:hypothetical protein, partial [Pseudoalteromonas sp. GABNS16G]|uniref:hypothetical protein n=1 Tax=Pseudoalteromonas sp. GABNS16G TaxID=3025324 RepID=UPI00235A1DD7